MEPSPVIIASAHPCLGEDLPIVTEPQTGITSRRTPGPSVWTRTTALILDPDQQLFRREGRWPKPAGDEVPATAILDRLLHRCNVIQISASSHRLRDLDRRPVGGETG